MAFCRSRQVLARRPHSDFLPWRVVDADDRDADLYCVADHLAGNALANALSCAADIEIGAQNENVALVFAVRSFQSAARKIGGRYHCA